MEGEGILGGCKVKKEVLEMRKKELHGKAITFVDFKKSRQSEEPGTLEQVKHRNIQEANRENVNGCTSQSTENNQHKEQS